MIVCTETDYNISLIYPCQCKNLTSIIINSQVTTFKDLYNNRKVNCLWHFASLWLKYLARYFQRISQNKNRLHFVFTLSLKVTKYTSKKLWTISFMTQLSPPAIFIRYLLLFQKVWLLKCGHWYWYQIWTKVSYMNLIHILYYRIHSMPEILKRFSKESEWTIYKGSIAYFKSDNILILLWNALYTIQSLFATVGAGLSVVLFYFSYTILESLWWVSSNVVYYVMNWAFQFYVILECCKGDVVFHT